MSLKVCIMAPDRVFWNASADEIILPTNTGQMGVLTNHTPLITGLDIGVMLVRPEKTSGSTTESGSWISMALMGGFALIKDNTVTILVNNVSYNIGDDINEFDEVKVTISQTGFIKLNCEKI